MRVFWIVLFAAMLFSLLWWSSSGPRTLPLSALEAPSSSSLPAAPPPSPAPAATIQTDFLSLAAEMDKVGSSFSESRLQELADRLSQAEAATFAALALNSSRSHNERFLAVFLLSQRPDAFADQLQAIAASRHPLLQAKPKAHSLEEKQRHFEEALRVQALLGWDKKSQRSAQDRTFLLGFKSHSSLLQQMARFSLQSPGNLEKQLDRKFQGAQSR